MRLGNSGIRLRRQPLIPSPPRQLADSRLRVWCFPSPEQRANLFSSFPRTQSADFQRRQLVLSALFRNLTLSITAFSNDLSNYCAILWLADHSNEFLSKFESNCH
jgi:hypothetical protein